MLIAHPSLTGMASGTGNSGSTQWINGPRARFYLTEITKDANDETDTGYRDLKVVKSNYGPAGDTVRLKWQNGVYVMPPKPTSVERIVADHKAEEVFLQLLDRFTSENRNVSAAPTSPNYAPATFAKEPEAAGLSKVDLGSAMRRLFTTKKIINVNYGRASRPNYRVAIRQEQRPLRTKKTR